MTKGMSLYVAYMDLEKAYGSVDRNAKWRALNFGVNGMLVNAISSFYAESEACVRV